MSFETGEAGFSGFDEMIRTDTEITQPSHEPYAPAYVPEKYGQSEAAVDGFGRFAHQIESFAQTAQALEENLAKERNYSRQLREYINQLNAYVQKLQASENQLRNQIITIQKRERQTIEQSRNMMTEVNRAREQIERYRRAWTDFQAKEQKIKADAADLIECKKRIAQLESELKTLNENYLLERTKNDEADKHVKKYRNELHESLVRLHQTESKFAELTHEIQILDQAKRSHQIELAKVEQVCRDRYELQLTQAKTQIESELKAKFQQEQDRARAESAQEHERTKNEFTQYFAEERKKAEEVFLKTLHAKEQELALAIVSLNKASLDAREAKNQISKSERSVDELRLKNRALQEELMIRERRVSALKEECLALQDIVAQEKKCHLELAEQIKTELADGDHVFLDPQALIATLEEAAATEVVTSEKAARAKPALPMPRARFDC